MSTASRIQVVLVCGILLIASTSAVFAQDGSYERAATPSTAPRLQPATPAPPTISPGVPSTRLVVPYLQPADPIPPSQPDSPDQYAAPRPTAPSATSEPDGRIAVLLRDGSRLIGELVGVKAFKLKTPYGELEIPSAKIQGIRFGDYPIGAGQVGGVLLSNGDMVSGKLALESIKLKAKWGVAEIPPRQVSSIIMTATAMTWSRGGGWNLVPGEQVPRFSVPYGEPASNTAAEYSSPSAPAWNAH